VGGCERKDLKLRKHGLCHGLRILRFFRALTPTRPSAQNDGGELFYTCTLYLVVVALHDGVLNEISFPYRLPNLFNITVR
jgi:hypothetical protein